MADPAVQLARSELSVDPGGVAVTTATVRNRSDQVEEYRFEVLGPLAAYSSVQPKRVQADVDREQMVTVQLRPPRGPGTPSGAVTLALRVISLEDESRCAVDEAVVLVGDVVDLSSELVPVCNRARWSGLYTIALHNRGTVAARVHLAAKSADRQLAFAVAPPVVSVPPGETATGYLRLRVRRPVLAGRPATVPFTALVEPLESAVAPSTLVGSFERLPVLSRLVAAGAVLAVAAAAVAAVLVIRTPVKSGVVAAPNRSVAASPSVRASTSVIASISASATTTTSGSTSSSSSRSGSAASSSGSASSTAPTYGPAPVEPYVLFDRIDPGQDQLVAPAVKELAALGVRKGVQTFENDQHEIIIYRNVASLEQGARICQPLRTSFSQCKAE